MTKPNGLNAGLSSSFSEEALVRTGSAGPVLLLLVHSLLKWPENSADNEEVEPRKHRADGEGERRERVIAMSGGSLNPTNTTSFLLILYCVENKMDKS